MTCGKVCHANYYYACSIALKERCRRGTHHIVVICSAHNVVGGLFVLDQRLVYWLVHGAFDVPAKQVTVDVVHIHLQGAEQMSQPQAGVLVPAFCKLSSHPITLNQANYQP